VSTGDTSSDGHSAQPAKPRDVRDRALFRIAALAVVLLAAFLATKSCARQDNVSQSEAIAIAKEQVDFTPDKVQIRYVPQGVPPVYYWAVSLYTLQNGQPNRVQVVLVNATTGAVRRT
jgi:Peptidase propeptide and YPEB domain